jgi:hypothetical protein
MSDTFWIAISIVVVVLIIAMALRGKLGSIAVTFFGKSGVSAKSDRAETVVSKSKAGRNIKISHHGGGTASVSDSEAGGNIDITNNPKK